MFASQYWQIGLSVKTHIGNYEVTYGVIIQGLDGAFLRLENQVICRVTHACIQRIP